MPSEREIEETLKAGTLLVIETGEYSDRSWCGPVRLLRNTTKTELAEAFKIEWKAEDYGGHADDSVNPSDFVPWLIKTGRAEDVDNVHAWHIGSYGCFEPW